MEWIATILNPKDAEEEAVHSKHDSTPNEYCKSLFLWLNHARNFQCEGNSRKRKGAVCDNLALMDKRRRACIHRHTHGRDYLSLQPKLIREATRKVADSPLAIASNIGNLSDMVEHVAAREK